VPLDRARSIVLRARFRLIFQYPAVVAFALGLRLGHVPFQVFFDIADPARQLFARSIVEDVALVAARYRSYVARVRRMVARQWVQTA
jgi:hypothetical protein